MTPAKYIRRLVRPRISEIGIVTERRERTTVDRGEEQRKLDMAATVGVRHRRLDLGARASMREGMSASTDHIRER
jgi:hypothetical protein